VNSLINECKYYGYNGGICNNLAKEGKIVISGYVVPLSHLLTAGTDTPMCNATSSCYRRFLMKIYRCDRAQIFFIGVSF